MHQPRGEHAVARGLDESKLDAALSFINHHSQPFRRGEAGLSLRLLIMSAEAFEALQKEIDPTNRAFNDHMNAVTREYERLQSLQRELQEDDRSFNAVMQKARVRLEGTSKSLSAAYSKRSRLQKELERCNEEISSLEADKHKTSDKIQALTRRGTEQREKKLRELGGAGGGSAPSPVAAASVASQGGPSVDLMGGDLMGEASASSAAPHEDDLLGGSHGIDLMSELALAPPAPAAGANRASASGGHGGANDADGFDGFDGFDVGDAGAGGGGAFGAPPAGMMGAAPGMMGGAGMMGAAGAPRAGAAPPLGMAQYGAQSASAPNQAPRIDPFAGLESLLG